MSDEEKKDGRASPARAEPEVPAGPDEEKQGDAAAPEGAEKTIDEDWKAEARREKEKLEKKIEEKRQEREERAESRELPPADFLHFISGMAAQVLMQLGAIENPLAGEKALDLAAARYSIDILQMFEEKTKGNLTPDETKYLSSALHDLRMRFVEAATGSGGKAGGDAGSEAGPS